MASKVRLWIGQTPRLEIRFPSNHGPIIKGETASHIVLPAARTMWPNWSAASNSRLDYQREQDNQGDPIFIANSATVAQSASIGEGSKVWDLAQIRDSATLGANCIVGRGAYIGTGVSVGDNSKIQNNALLYEPASLGRGVFVGPAVVFTNDNYPRAINPDGTQKSAEDWTPTGVTVEEGAAIGAHSVCVAPVRIGRWATIAAGAVVTNDVPDFALMAGVPARRIGWVGKSGRPLSFSEGIWACPTTGERYQESASGLTEVRK